MRGDWFLPVLRTPRPDRPLRRPNRLVRWARRVLPARLFSDPATKKRGLLRRGLRRLGMGWLASPLRRLVQTASFALFLILFTFVIWPYDARPAGSSQRWIPVALDPAGGTVEVIPESGEKPDVNWLSPGVRTFARDDAEGLIDDPSVLEFEVISSSEEGITLETFDLTDPRWQELTLSPGPWSLHEKDPRAWPDHYAANLAGKELISAELFLILDPLVSLSTAVASRAWIWSLGCAGIILGICLLIPRGFCGYLCPLGTLIDLFDWSVGRRIQRFRVGEDGWWVHIKYYLLAGVLVSAGGGVLLSGFVAAIPVITRGLLFTVSPVETGLTVGWHQIPPIHTGHAASLLLFAAVLGLGLLRPRFWCRYVCPSGALFSLGNLFRFTERKVESSCIHCNKCIEICPFDAIKPDFTTRTTDCTFCQSCGGVCPTHAIKFVDRWEIGELKPVNIPPTGETRLGRRGFLSLAVGSSSAILGGLLAGLGVAKPTEASQPGQQPIRPPGSVPEPEFLQMCIRCGECFQSCPSDVLQPMGFEQGLDGLWTPHVVADWAGCASSCNACGQVCPTGAIRAIPIEEKRHVRMGLAVINDSTCLPFHGEPCQLCVDECTAAGYNALEFLQVGTEMDEDGQPIEGTGTLAPLLLPDQCVGCGLCQTRCHAINVQQTGQLERSAIIIETGHGHEDRIMSGSYIELREQEQQSRLPTRSPDSGYLPGFLEQP